jgi:hypothetical protein
MKKIELDADIADGITLLVLQEHRDLIREQLVSWQNNPKSEANPAGYYLHPEDVTGNMQLVAALDQLIKYFGGKDET